MRRVSLHVLRRLLSVADDPDAVVAAAPPVAPRDAFRRFWPYTRGGRRFLIPILVFSVIGPVVDAAEIWLFKIVVDDVLVPRDLRPSSGSPWHTQGSSSAPAFWGSPTT